MTQWLSCVRCARRYPTDEVRYRCECGGLLAFEREKSLLASLSSAVIEARRSSKGPLDASGVWRFRELVADVPEAQVVTHPEGATRLYERAALTDELGLGRLGFKHEGENPTGSFKDRGMTVAVSQAVRVGARALACASTGNTSASLAAYAAQAGLPAFVFVPAGKVALGKLAQTVGYGATCVELEGDFDAAMQLVTLVCEKLNVYLVNSINPFRIEGQKTIVWELLADRGWQVPDWLCVPAGNLGNTSAFGKALVEAREAGWISRLPRLLCVQAAGANPFAQSFRQAFRSQPKVQAQTVATAIRIGDPVSFEKARAAVEATAGVVTDVSDEEILSAKARIDRAGIGCEPASAATLAGVRRLRREGLIAPGADVVCVLTGHMLKDPEATLSSNPDRTLRLPARLDAVEAALQPLLGA